MALSCVLVAACTQMPETGESGESSSETGEEQVGPEQVPLECPDTGLELPGEDRVLLVSVSDGVEQALWWLDLAAEDPAASAAELLAGPWVPSEGASDGRYAFVRLEADEPEGLLLDLRELPPTPVDPGLPAGHLLRDGETTPDGSALIVRAYDEVSETEYGPCSCEQLWKIPLDEQGELGTPELLTEARLGFAPYFPMHRAYAAEGGALALAATNVLFDGKGAWVLDLDGEQGMRAGGIGGEEYVSDLHLTPDGGELAGSYNNYADPRGHSRWVDLEVEPLAKGMMGPPSGGQGQYLGPWACDDRRVLLRLDLEGFYDPEASALAYLGDESFDWQLLDPLPEPLGWSQFDRGGEYVLMRAVEGDSLWAARTLTTLVGPPVALAGGALGEAPLVHVGMDAGRDFVLLVRRVDESLQHCELARFEGGELVERRGLGACAEFAGPVARAGHVYVSTFEEGQWSLWHTRAGALMEPPELVMRATERIRPWSVSASGEWLVVRLPEQVERLVGPGTPLEGVPLSFEGADASGELALVP